MSTIHELVQAAYPGADPMTDYIVRDDGAGPYLAEWHIAGPVPAGVNVVAETPIQRWYAASKALCRTATIEIIDKTATPQRIYATADLEALIAAAEPGAELAPGVTREMLEEMSALWAAFGAWSQTAISDARAHGKTPLQILSELGGA